MLAGHHSPHMSFAHLQGDWLDTFVHHRGQLQHSQAVELHRGLQGKVCLPSVPAKHEDTTPRRIWHSRVPGCGKSTPGGSPGSQRSQSMQQAAQHCFQGRPGRAQMDPVGEQQHSQD